MGLTGCHSVLKYFLFLINFIFWITGLSLIILSIWSLTDPFYISMTQEQTNYNIGIFLLLGTGILLFIVGFFGCCGVMRNSKFLLVLFICYLLIILVAEVSFVIWAYMNRDELHDLVHETVKITVEEEYGEDNTRTKTFDIIQKDLQCCGAKSPSDWLANKHSNKEKALKLGISSPVVEYKIPVSCCREDLPTTTNCKISNDGWTSANLSSTVDTTIYKDGCADKLINTLEDSKHLWLALFLLIVICQLCGLIFSLILCCSMQKPHYSAIHTRNKLL